MPSRDNTNTIERIALAVEQLVSEQDSFTAVDFLTATDMSRSYTSAILPILVKANIMEVTTSSVPYTYRMVRSMKEAFESGELRTIWKSNRTYSPRKNAAVPRQEKQPQGPQPIEIQDPMELLEQLHDDDFGQLMSWYFQRQRGEIQPLKDQVKDLQTRLELMNSNGNAEDSKLRHENDTLRRELRDEREKIIHLRNELQSANNMLVRKEPPMKIVMVDKGRSNDNNQQREHGGSSNVKAGYVVHGKPYTGHAPATVLNRDRDKDKR
jgi:archaellum component FlaC